MNPRELAVFAVALLGAVRDLTLGGAFLATTRRPRHVTSTAGIVTRTNVGP